MKPEPLGRRARRRLRRAAAGRPARRGLLAGRVNDVAMGIAIMLAGTGIAFFFGKPYMQPSATACCPASRSAPGPTTPQIATRCRLSAVPARYRRGHRPSLVLQRDAGRVCASASLATARTRRCALGLPIDRTRFLATACGSALAGIGGAFLSLYYPGSWNEGLSSGQGLMAVALVVFSRWNPINCIYASLLFGAAGALGASLQTVGITWATTCSTPPPTS